MHKLSSMRLLPAITVALLFGASALVSSCADELPIDNVCEIDPDPAQCPMCESDDDCMVGGNPCCNAKLRYHCFHKSLESKLLYCEDKCIAPAKKPDDSRCQCIDGQCAAN